MLHKLKFPILHDCHVYAHKPINVLLLISIPCLYNVDSFTETLESPSYTELGPFWLCNYIKLVISSDLLKIRFFTEYLYFSPKFRMYVQRKLDSVIRFAKKELNKSSTTFEIVSLAAIFNLI